MASPVMIKGNKYGVTLVCDDKMPFDELLPKIEEKFKSSAKFFDTEEDLAIVFDKRRFSTDEELQVLDAINAIVSANFSIIIDRDEIVEKVFEAHVDPEAAQDSEEIGNAEAASDKAKISGAESNSKSGESADNSDKESDIKVPDEVKGDNATDATATEEDIKSGNVSVIPKHAPKGSTGSIDNVTSNVSPVESNDDLGHFYRGTLRSGQSIEFASSIVVIGDVNPGAKVIAKGNIIVIGSLKGAAYAGVGGSRKAFIIALDMDPMQLRIGDLYARSPDNKGFLKKRNKPVSQMQIAYVENENIYIEPINKDVLGRII